MRIILFDIDCLRPDHLGCYGYPRPTSPTLDAIAKQGIHFDHYYCADSPCLPSRTGFASGRFGSNTGVVSNIGGVYTLTDSSAEFDPNDFKPDDVVRILDDGSEAHPGFYTIIDVPDPHTLQLADDPGNATQTVEDKAETGSLESMIDTSDWYKIFLSPSGSGNQATMATASLTLAPSNQAYVGLSLQFSTSGDVNDLDVLDSDYTYDYQTYTYTHTAEANAIINDAGYYYIRLSIYEGSVANYTLTITTTVVMLDGNNDFGNATQITVPYDEINDVQKGVDPNDYYELSLVASQTTADVVTVEVTCLGMIELQVTIYDADQQQLSSLTVTDNGTESKTFTAGYTGTYYILVRLSSWSTLDAGEYQLKVTKETQPSDGNNHFLSATEVVNGDEIQETLDEVIDREDYFQIRSTVGTL